MNITNYGWTTSREVARYAYGTTTFGGDKVTFIFTASPDGKQQSGFIVNPNRDK